MGYMDSNYDAADRAERDRSVYATARARHDALRHDDDAPAAAPSLADQLIGLVLERRRQRDMALDTARLFKATGKVGLMRRYVTEARELNRAAMSYARRFNATVAA